MRSLGPLALVCVTATSTLGGCERIERAREEARLEESKLQTISAERALPSVDASGWTTTSHPSYPLSARLPAGWRATPDHDDIIPVDTWKLEASSADDAARVWIGVEWLPRHSRHSSGFPGGLLGDEVTWKHLVAGVERPVTLALGGAVVRGDLDTAELALSVKGHAQSPKDRAIVRKIIELLKSDDRVKPPAAAAAARRALDLTRAWAKGKGLPTDGIVSTNEGRSTGRFSFTVFYPHGLTSVTVDPVAGTVTPDKL